MVVSGEKGLTRLQVIGIFVGILVGIVGLVSAGVAFRHYVIKRAKIAALRSTAEEFQRHDQFEKAKNKLSEAQALDPENREIQIRLVEIETFQTASEYDQIKLVKDQNVVPALKDTCIQLKQEVPNEPRIIALCGIVDDLDDNPTQALQGYTDAAKLKSDYPNVYNYWGYTKFKWNLGDQDQHWAEDALAQFSKAISFDKSYGIPYMNRAVVYLTVNDLDKAKENLDAASTRIPQSPRIELLWGHYFVKRAIQLQQQNMADSQGMFQHAVEHYQNAKGLNPAIADIRLYLGRAYEAVGRTDDALSEYADAVRLDTWNLDACMYNAQLHIRLQQRATGATEAERCQKLSRGIVAELTSRMHQTTDLWARQWLQSEISGLHDAATKFARFVRAPPLLKPAKKKMQRASMINLSSGSIGATVLSFIGGYEKGLPWEHPVVPLEASLFLKESTRNG